MQTSLLWQKNCRSNNNGLNIKYRRIEGLLWFLVRYPVKYKSLSQSTNEISNCYEQARISVFINYPIYSDVADKNLLINSEYNSVPHNVISSKGSECIKCYESLTQLFL